MIKRFTMRDDQNHVVAGLENVEEGNALLQRIAYDKALSSLDVGETAHGMSGAGQGAERYYVTRTE